MNVFQQLMRKGVLSRMKKELVQKGGGIKGMEDLWRRERQVRPQRQVGPGCGVPCVLR